MGLDQVISKKKIAHEAPMGIMGEVQKLTDYDYALVHLFEENQQYYDFFKEAIANGREVILDNSLYELGEAFDAEKYAWWIKRLEPTEYIIPDVLGEAEHTVWEAKKWIQKYSDLPGKKIGVVQGNSYHEMVECYNGLLNADVDKIAFTFRGPAYEEIIGGHTVSESVKLASWALGRIAVLERMLDEGVIATDLPHHLLGCAQAFEFSHYRHPKFNWIESIDTSNPVTLGMDRMEYASGRMIPYKPKVIIAESMNISPFAIGMGAVERNIQTFKNLVNG